MTRHPRRARLSSPASKVDAIAAAIGASGVFCRRHAVLARRVDGQLQLIDGHTRIDAAEKAGVEQVWAWVVECDDEEADMMLVTENIQSELTPLEIGLHCLKTCEPHGGGKGIKGGISAYAARIGYSRNRLTVLRRAAAVAESCRNMTSSLSCFTDKVDHLAEIGKIAAERLWPALVAAFMALDNVAGESWTIGVTRQRCNDVAAAINSIPIDMKAFAPDADIVGAIVTGGMSPGVFADIVLCWSRLKAAAKQVGEAGDAPLKSFEDWMVENAGHDAFNHTKVMFRSQKAQAAMEGRKRPAHEVVVMRNGPQEWDAVEAEWSEGALIVAFNGGDAGNVMKRAAALGCEVVDVGSLPVEDEISATAFIDRRIQVAVFSKHWVGPDRKLRIEGEQPVPSARIEAKLREIAENLWLGCKISFASMAGNPSLEPVGVE